MIDAVALSVALACLMVAVLVAIRLATRRYRWRAVVPALLAIEAMLVVLAVLDIAGLAGGHHPAEPATHLAYLGTALVVLPVAASQAAGDDGVWAGLLVAAAAVVLAVLIVRLQTTWRPARACLAIPCSAAPSQPVSRLALPASLSSSPIQQRYRPPPPPRISRTWTPLATSGDCQTRSRG